jgi:hypothetical protein
VPGRGRDTPINLARGGCSGTVTPRLASRRRSDSARSVEFIETYR